MRHKYKVHGPFPGTTYPEYEVRDERGYTAAYVHDPVLAEIFAEVASKKRRPNGAK